MASVFGRHSVMVETYCINTGTKEMMVVGIGKIRRDNSRRLSALSEVFRFPRFSWPREITLRGYTTKVIPDANY